MKLSLKTLLIISGIALSIMGASIFFLYRTIADTSEGEIGRARFGEATNDYSSLSRLVEERFRDAQLVSGDSVFVNASGGLATGASTSNRLNEVFKEMGVWGSIRLVDTKGEVVYGTENIDLSESIGEHPENEKAFASALSGEDYYSDVVICPEKEKPTVIFAIPVTNDGGSVVGVLVFHYSWVELLETVSNLDFADVHLLNKDGIVLASKNEGELEDGILQNNHQDSEAFKRAVEKGSGFGSLPDIHTGEESLTAIVKSDEFPNLGWIFVAQTPSISALATAQQAAVQMSVSLVFVTFLAGIVAWVFISASVVRPIQNLTSVSRKMAEGDLKQRVKVTSQDEIGVLGTAVNQLAKSLEVSRSTLERKVKERTNQLAGAKAELEKQQAAIMNVMEDLRVAKEFKEQESESLLQTLGEGVVVTDDEGRFTYINPAFEKLFGFSFKDLDGKLLVETIKGFDVKENPLPKEVLSNAAAVTAKRKERKMLIESKDGKKVPVIMYATPVYLKSEFKGVIRIIHDYTEELTLQRQKDDFFSIASHELRTPLTVIAGNLDTVSTNLGEEKIGKDYYNLMKDTIVATDRLIKMVNDFLNVSRLDQGRLRINLQEIDPCNTVKEAVDELMPLVSKGVKLNYSCKVDSIKIPADESLVKEVLINLVGNSIKFTKKGSISVSQSVERGKLITVISDTGAGIYPEYQKLLFQRFQQATKRTLAREAGGTGLGLYISREFARLMGGDVYLVKSEPEKGTTFAFSLPLKQNNSKVKKSGQSTTDGKKVKA